MGANTACTAARCLEKQFVFGNVCMDCAPGTTRPAGDSTGGADTACFAIIYKKPQGLKAPVGSTIRYPLTWTAGSAQPLSCRIGYEGNPTIVGNDETGFYSVEFPCTSIMYIRDPTTELAALFVSNVPET